MSEKLKPLRCPFSKHDVVIEKKADEYIIECVCGFSASWKDKNELIQEWNKGA